MPSRTSLAPRLLVALGLACAELVASRPVRGDCCWPSGSDGTGVLVAALLLPSSLGADTDARVLVGWPTQIPLEERATQRLVVTPRLAARTDRPLATFDLRVGYRWAPSRGTGGRRIDLVLGAGALVEGAPVARPLASPEVGLRFGQPAGSADFGALYLLLQGDFGVPTRDGGTTPPARVGLTLAWGLL
jgi:hypothetical protein